MPLASAYIDYQRDPGKFALDGYEMQDGMGLSAFGGRGIDFSGGDVSVFRGRGEAPLLGRGGHVLRPSPGVIMHFAHVSKPSYGRLTGRAARMHRRQARRGNIHGSGLFSTLKSGAIGIGRAGLRAANYVVPIVGRAAIAAGTRAAVAGATGGPTAAGVAFGGTFLPALAGEALASLGRGAASREVLRAAGRALGPRSVRGARAGAERARIATGEAAHRAALALATAAPRAGLRRALERTRIGIGEAAHIAALERAAAREGQGARPRGARRRVRVRRGRV